MESMSVSKVVRTLRPRVVPGWFGSNRRKHNVNVHAYNGDLPEWFVNLKELAKDDAELADLLVEAKGDPDILEAKLKKEMDALHTRLVGDSGGSGEEMPPRIRFRDIDPFDTWVWMELYNPPTGGAAEMLQEVVNSWFMLGRLGAYDSSNLQVLYSDGANSSLEYIDGHGEPGSEPSMRAQLQSTMHDMGEIEYQGSWARFWVDMGTSDELGFDILINALRTFSREHVGIRQIVFGGENDDWSIPDSDLAMRVGEEF